MPAPFRPLILLLFSLALLPLIGCEPSSLRSAEPGDNRISNNAPAYKGPRPKIARPTAPDLDRFSAGNKHAILAAVGRYADRGLQPLDYVVNDIRELERILTQQGYTVWSVTDYDATQGNIRQKFELLRDERPGTLLFAFSGHGFQAGGDNYLATYETTAADIERTGLAIDQIERLFKSTGAERGILFVDACRSTPGAMSGGRSFSDEAARGLHILYSTAPGEVSWEDPALGHSVFSHFLLKGLRGERDRHGNSAVLADGAITMHSLTHYITDQMQAYSAESHRTQLPYYTAKEALGVPLIARINAADTSSVVVSATSGATSGAASEGARGTLRLATTPSGASWYLDNRYQGETPAETALPVGRHPLRVSLAGHQEWSGVIDITPGGVARQRLTLAPQGPSAHQGDAFAAELERQQWATARQENSVASYQRYLENCERCTHRAEATEQREAALLRDRQQQDARLWQSARATDTLEAYDRYLTTCGLCAESREAERLKAVAQQRLHQAEDQRLWEQAQGSDSDSAYEAYLRGCQLCEQREAAHQRQLAARERAQQRAADNALFQRAEQAGSLEAYRTYLSLCEASGCGHQQSAEQAIEHLRWRAESGSGGPLGSARDPHTGMEFVTIPGGCFQMGSPASEEGRDSDEDQHRVCIDRAFAMAKHEVTFAEYDRFAQATGRAKPSDRGWGRGNRPVINVSWHDATAYAEWLSRESGKRYRLPTEAEWEYAARAGTTTAYWWGGTASHEYANYGKDSCCGGLARGADRWEYTSPVGSFPANPWGLHDTAGNVWEWTCSRYASEYDGHEGRCESNNRASGPLALRGGSWSNFPHWVRSANRGSRFADFRKINVGFRLAQD